jgi:hypothetical protein
LALTPPPDEVWLVTRMLFLEITVGSVPVTASAKLGL